MYFPMFLAHVSEPHARRCILVIPSTRRYFFLVLALTVLPELLLQLYKECVTNLFVNGERGCGFFFRR